MTEITVQQIQNEVNQALLETRTDEADVAEKLPLQVRVMEPIEIYRRNIRTMEPRQLVGHLNRKIRKTKKSGSMIDGAWSIILSTVYQNTEPQIVGDDNRVMATELKKAFGKISPGIR